MSVAGRECRLRSNQNSEYKNIGYVWRAIKLIPQPQEFYRTEIASPGSEIPGSATADGYLIVSCLFVSMLYTYLCTHMYV